MTEERKKDCLSGQKVRDSKKIYEKPKMGKVALFADQVLASCRAPIVGSVCGIPDNNFS